VGSYVIVGPDGRLLAWLGRRENTLVTFLREEPVWRDKDAAYVAQTLAHIAERGDRRAILISQVDGEPPTHSALSNAFITAGFQSTSQGYLKRAPRRP
jgi:hypothetical protein